jgi:predicted lipoprotein
LISKTLSLRAATMLSRPVVVLRCVVVTWVVAMLAACTTPSARAANAGATARSARADQVRDDWAAGIDSLRTRVRVLESAAVALAGAPTPSAISTAHAAFTDAH